MRCANLFFLLLLLQGSRCFQRPLAVKSSVRARAASTPEHVVTNAKDIPKAKSRATKGSKGAKERGARKKSLKYESSIVPNDTNSAASDPPMSKPYVDEEQDRIRYVKCKAMALHADCKASMKQERSSSPLKTVADAEKTGPVHSEGPEAVGNTPPTKKASAIAAPTPLPATAKVIRELGSYEKLLSRKTPGLNTVSLSHSSVFLFPAATTDNSQLMGAIGRVVQMHPQLRCGIRAMRGSLYFVDYQKSAEEIAASAYSKITTSAEGFEGAWKEAYASGLNAAEFPEEGPFWKLTHVVSPSESAFVFSMNHGIDDQASVNIMMEDILRFYAAPASGVAAAPKAFPPSIERAVAGDALLTVQTFLWTAFQSLNSLLLPSMLPDSVTSADRAVRAEMARPEARRTFCEFVKLSSDETTELVAMCKANKLTVTNLLSALMLVSTSELIQDRPHLSGARRRSLNLRFLLSVGLRSFGLDTEGGGQQDRADFTGETVACASGAVDFVLPVRGSLASKYCDASSIGRADLEGLFSLSRACARKGDEIINKWGFVPESVRLFDLGFKLVDILQAVELEARNSASLGRGYSCGVSNMGVVSLDGSAPSALPSPVAGFYATSHGRNGVLAQLSCMTINGQFNGCLQFTEPIVSRERAALFRNKFEALIRRLLVLNKAST